VGGAGLPFGWLGHHGGVDTGRVEVRERFLDAEAGGGELVRVHDRGPPAGRYIYTAPPFTIAAPLHSPCLGLQTQVDPSS
jgi:hypothetical protein